MRLKSLALFWQIPLACLSFLLFKVVKLLVGLLYSLYLSVNQKRAGQWQVLSAETLEKFLSLPVLMTKGPRWNTHAIISTLGPFSVKQSIAIDVESANLSANSWFAVVYYFPGYETITSFQSELTETGDRWQSITVKPGKYSLGLRYYDWNKQVKLPMVKLDDQVFVNPQEISTTVNQFYANLSQKSNGFYFALHYYIFVILKLRKYLPASFIRQEYLPVGAPDTDFFYHYFNQNQKLNIKIEADLLQDYQVYLTLYNRASFPIFSQQIVQDQSSIESINYDGFYLIRMRKMQAKISQKKDQLISKIQDSCLSSQQLSIRRFNESKL